MAAENFKVKKGLEVGTGITANSDGIDVTGIVTATQFQGDGSGLTGVVGSGSGVIVKDEGSAVGTAGTINFVGTGVSAAISEGTATVTFNSGSSNVSVANQADNRLITATGTTDALNAESNLTLASNGTMTLNGQATIDEVNINDNIIQTNTSNELVVRGKGVGGSHHLKLDDDVTIVGVTSGTIFKVPDATNAAGATNHIAVGDNSDLKLYHDNNGDAYVSNATGHLTIRNDTAGRIINLQPKSGANGVIVRYEGAAELYHNNQIKLTTTTSGIEVPDLNVTGVGTIGRMDTNGVTLGTNNNTFAAKFIDDAVANFGTDNDLKISHDDTHARITNTKGDIVVSGIISATSDVKVGSAITMDPTSGIITATSFSGSGAGLTSIPSAQLSGALPALDGSALTGVTASGSGIIVKHDGSTVGTAGTINFSTNLDVTPISAGIVTVTASSGGAIDSISEGNTKAEVSDSGTDGKFFVETEGSERFSISNSGNFTFNTAADNVINHTGNITIDYKMYSSTKIRNFTKSDGFYFYPMSDTYPFVIGSGFGSQPIKFYRTGEINVGTGITLSGSTGIITATTFSGSGALLTSLDAGNLGVGTIPNGRFPATLPAASGANLTSLTAGNISGTLATGQIADNAVTFAKMQDVGTGVFIGRNDSGSGDIETLTAAEARTLLNVADGATAGITTASSNIQATWDVIHQSSSAYRFTGPGQDGAENNPDIYLVRGHKYRFSLSSTSGSHPLQIRTTGGTTYTDGVTYSDTGNNRTTAGNDLDISVQHDAPAALKYHCTAHGAMVGNIYIVGQHLANGADNRVVTATSAYGMNGESGLTYNGSLLGVTGDIAVSTANRLYFGNSDVAWVKGEHGGSGYLELGVNSGHVRILRNGRVGIGTEDPHTQLTVAADSAQAIVTLKRTNSNGGSGSYGAINFAALDGHSVANMYALGDGNDDGAHLIFKTTSAAASNDTYNAATEERVRINSIGNVGIATNMSGGGGAYGRLSVVIPSQSDGAALQVMNSALGSGDGSLSNIVLRSVNSLGTQWAGAEYRAQEHVFKNQASEALRIKSSGKINIGGADQTQNVDQFSVTIDAQNAVDNVARFQSAAAASGTSESLVKVYKGAGYGGVISGYITQGSDHGLKFYTADNGSLTERLRISKPGHITTPSNPAFHARPPGNYTISGNQGIIGGTWSTSDSESFVRGTLANGNSIWDNSTGIFTVPVTGIYYIHWSVFLANNTTRRDAYIYRGSDIIARTEIGDPGSSGNNKSVSVSTVVSLTVNDEIKFAALTTGGTTIYQTAKPWSYACAYLVG